MRLLAVASTFLAFSNPPPVLERIARCETGNNPAHSTRDFVSRFGIYRPAWNEFKPAWVRPVPYRRVHGERHPTVLEQNAVAMTIARQVGLSAWSCHRMYGWVRNG